MNNIKKPNTKVKLSNVSVVRLRKNGKRFEIACYKNKVLSYKKGIEKELDEVLQIETIFSNVSRGIAAKRSDIKRAFKDINTDAEICKIILKKGTLQVSERERKQEAEGQLKDVANIIVSKCINSETKRPIPISMIESAMKEIGFSLKPNKSTKVQALDVIKRIKEAKILPIERAQMKISIHLPQGKNTKNLKNTISEQCTIVEEEWDGGELDLVVLVDPGVYTKIEKDISNQTKGKSTFEILEMSVKQEGSEEF